MPRQVDPGRRRLRPEPDVGSATWFTSSSGSWVQLCCYGPAGFDRYIRLFHPLARGADGSDRDDLVNVEGNLDAEVLDRLVSVLTRHTGTPDDCLFGLWEGYGDIHGSPGFSIMTIGRARRTRSARIPPAFPPSVMDGPKVHIPARSYFLFRGPLDQAGRWGAADLLPGQPRRLNSPNLMWPADHAWFVASEIDQPWTGIGCGADLAEDLLADSHLDVELDSRREDPPYWR